MTTPTEKTLKIQGRGFTVVLNPSLKLRVAAGTFSQVPFGTKVIYPTGRGSYDLGYYLGSSKNEKLALCLFGGSEGYYPCNVSRVDPNSLLVTNWEDHHLASGLGLFNALEEVRKQL